MKCLHCVRSFTVDNSSIHAELCQSCESLYCVDCSTYVGVDPKYVSVYQSFNGRTIREVYCVSCYLEVLQTGGIV